MLLVGYLEYLVIYFNGYLELMTFFICYLDAIDLLFYQLSRLKYEKL